MAQDRIVSISWHCNRKPQWGAPGCVEPVCSENTSAVPVSHWWQAEDPNPLITPGHYSEDAQHGPWRGSGTQIGARAVMNKHCVGLQPLRICGCLFTSIMRAQCKQHCHRLHSLSQNRCEWSFSGLKVQGSSSHPRPTFPYKKAETQHWLTVFRTAYLSGWKRSWLTCKHNQPRAVCQEQYFWKNRPLFCFCFFKRNFTQFLKYIYTG